MVRYTYEIHEKVSNINNNQISLESGKMIKALKLQIRYG
jgi:hypothetical protein